MSKQPDMETYSKVFQMLWSIWKYCGIRHSDSEAWEKVVGLSDAIIKTVPEDKTMHEVARTLLTGLEKRADELREEEQQAHGKSNDGS